MTHYDGFAESESERLEIEASIMTTPKELADKLTEALFAVEIEDGSGNYSADVQEVVAGASKVFAAANRELAEELRKLEAEAWKKSNQPGLGFSQLSYWDGQHQAYGKAAQMVEERLNGA